MALLNSTRKLIYDTFLTAWNNRTPSTLDNEEFDEPENAAWVRVTVKTQPSRQDTLGQSGNRKFLRTGIVFVQVFVVKESGTKEADALSEIVRDTFEAMRINGVWFFETDIFENIDDPKYFGYTCQTEFNYEQIK